MAQPSRTPAVQLLENRVAKQVSLTAEDIAQRAYTLYIARRSEDGHDVDDWLEAERQLLEERGRSEATGV